MGEHSKENRHVLLMIFILCATDYYTNLSGTPDENASLMSNVLARNYAIMFKAARKHLICMESEHFQTTGTMH